MNKFKFLGISGIVACSWFASPAQQINPVTEAVLRDYAEILAENPKDYYTLYDRASQYIEIGEFNRALSDIDLALEYTPESDSDYRLAEFSLKGDILTALKDYEGAIAAENSALAINPVSLNDLYKLGNLYILTGKPEEALKAFQALQRENPRSQEAFYGMAKANAMLGNAQETEKLISEVESLGKQSFLTYCRIGDLYADMGNVKEAAANYTVAFTMEDKSARPVESMKMLARKNPIMVMETLDGVIAGKPENLALNYLKAIVAFDGGMFPVAEKACRDLLAGLDQPSPVVYRMMAMSQLAQDKLTDAVESIAAAERLAPGDNGVLLDKAQILMSSDPESAFTAASEALKSLSDNEAALSIAAKAAILAGKYQEAQALLNDIVLGNPSNAEALLLRGYLNTEFLKDGKAGIADYTRAGNVHQSGSVRDLALAALGKSLVNKKLDAEGMIGEAVGKAGNNKDDLYVIAVYYAQSGNLEKAKEFADRALVNGYGNLYNLQSSNEPLLNLKPIRHLMGK